MQEGTKLMKLNRGDQEKIFQVEKREKEKKYN